MLGDIENDVFILTLLWFLSFYLSFSCIWLIIKLLILLLLLIWLTFALFFSYSSNSCVNINFLFEIDYFFLFGLITIILLVVFILLDVNNEVGIIGERYTFDIGFIIDVFIWER